MSKPRTIIQGSEKSLKESIVRKVFLITINRKCFIDFASIIPLRNVDLFDKFILKKSNLSKKSKHNFLKVNVKFI